jgi:elongation factor G
LTETIHNNVRSPAYKPSLGEALLHAAGAIARLGAVDAGIGVGDASPQSRSMGEPTELNLMRFKWRGDRHLLADAPAAGIDWPPSPSSNW